MSGIKALNTEFSERAKTLLIRARIQFLLKHPFFGSMAMSMPLVEDNSFPTAATDGYGIFYNSEFLCGFTTDEVQFILGHEILHAVYFHLSRRQNRHPKLWNFACDYAINGDLIRHKVGKYPTSNGIKLLHNTKYDKLTAEEIYDKLFKKLKKKADKAAAKQKESGDGDLSEEEMEKGQFDKHIERDDEQEARKMREAMVRAAQAAAQAGSSDDNLPERLREMLRSITSPVIDWRELISEKIKALVRDDYSFQRPSRKGWHCDGILPGTRQAEQIDALVMLDMSGSIGPEDAAEMWTELMGITTQFTKFKIAVGCFDTQVYDVLEVDESTADRLMTFEIKGGGGTLFECIFDYIQTLDTPPRLLIVFTDGLPNKTWGTPDLVDTLWIIKNYREIVPPFGQYSMFPIKAAA